MATTRKPVYAASLTAITITLTNLASGAARQSLVIDNTANLYLDALVTLTLKVTGALSGAQAAYVYAYSIGDGSNYTDGASGTDVAYTMLSPSNLRQLGTVAFGAAGTITSPYMSVALAFGGWLPDKWGIVVQNQTGQPFDAAVGHASFTAVQEQFV